MLIIETVPLAITKGFDAGIVVATRSAPGMNHDGEEFKGQQTLRTDDNVFCNITSLHMQNNQQILMLTCTKASLMKICLTFIIVCRGTVTNN